MCHKYSDFAGQGYNIYKNTAELPVMGIIVGRVSIHETGFHKTGPFKCYHGKCSKFTSAYI